MKKWKNKLQSYLKHYRGSEEYEITWAEVAEKRKDKNAILVDVRSPQEYEEGHIDGAICLPHYELENRAEMELKQKEQTIILYCQSGARSKKAYRTLQKLGYTNLYHVKDGINRNIKQFNKERE